MAIFKNKAYREAEKRIAQANRTGTTKLNLSGMKLTELPDSLWELTQLRILHLNYNKLSELPDAIKNLRQLQELYLSDNVLTKLPDSIGNLIQLRILHLDSNKLSELPDSIGYLVNLQTLALWFNKLSDLPSSVAKLKNLKTLTLDNPFSDLDDIYGSNSPSPELAAAYKQGLDAVKTYSRAKAISGQITLNEAKLILVGEGEVGKTCLMDALEGKPWKEHDTTHGIDIREIKASDPACGTALTLNGWDFGGQRVYRPTHQLFFSAPAVYLVVWKPREGPQQGFVKEWIRLIKHREPEAKILVVATHGGPGARQPDIDRQELWDLFGKETVLDFFFVDSKPDANSQRHGIAELKDAIARTAAQLPEVGRSVPKR